MTTFLPRRAASSSDDRATATGPFGPSSGADHTGRSSWRPSTRSCSTAAGRWRSAATSSTCRPWLLSWRASFPAAVVFPEPWRPASMTTVGGFGLISSLPVVPPRVVTSSSCTLLMTCCAGLRLFWTSAPLARSFTRAMKPLTTLTLTSASSRARRISRATSSTSFSDRRPRPRRRVKMPSKRSDRASNIGTSVPAGLFEEGVDELVGIERDEVLGRLAHADDLHRQADLRLDREDDAAFRGAVELREDHPGHLDRVGELARLGETVLAGGRVDDEQHLLQRAGG